MSSLSLEDSEWFDTFPHVVTPLPGEWLPGLLLRCDEANGWLSGTTALFVSDLPGRNVLSTADYVAAEHIRLTRLAELLNLPFSALLATTFCQELRSLYGWISPLGSKLGDHLSLRICPACLAEARLFHYSLAFPCVRHCPLHSLVLQSKCSCARPLRLFPYNTAPFTCQECQQDWSKLAHIPVNPSQKERENSYLSLYTFFLNQGDWITLKRALYLIEEEKSLTVLLNPQRLREPRDNPYFGEDWLARLVVGLTDLGFSVQDVIINRYSQEWDERRCLNRTCPCSEEEFKSNSGLYGYYRFPEGFEEPIWFCKVCGSCFLRNRLCLTFDQECGGDDSDVLYPAKSSITKAQEILKEWKRRLQSTCFLMHKGGQEITIERAFAQANIPALPNLQATRLGLVEVVRKYMSPQQRWRSLFES